MSDSESSSTLYGFAVDNDGDDEDAGSDTPIFESDDDDVVVILESDEELLGAPPLETVSRDPSPTASNVDAPSDVINISDSTHADVIPVVSPPLAAPEVDHPGTSASTDPSETRSPPRKRKRDSLEPEVAEPEVAEPKVDPKEEDDEEGRVCTICFEEWTNSGDHRIASLRCGHLFGLSCVTKWLIGGGKKCPQCNETAKPKDVRVIFCRRLKAIDTAERDRALSDLDKEKKKRLLAEATISELRVQLEIQKTEKTRLLRELEKSRNRSPSVDDRLSDASSSTDDAPLRYAPWRREAVADGGCRLVAFCSELDSFLLSRQRSNPLFPGFGVQMIRADFSQQKYIPLHTKQIKCLSVNGRSSYLLSVGMDKQIKLTALNTGNPIASFTSSRALWACCWDDDDENRFYVGLDSGVIHVYDMRRRQDHSNPTENFVAAIENVVSKTPVVSINFVPTANGQSACPSRGLLVGHLDGKCVFYEETVETTQSQTSQPAKRWRPHILPLEGSLMSLCFESTTRSLLATFRPNGKYPRVRHVLAGLVKVTSGISCNTPKVLEGGHSQKVLTKSSLFVSSSESRPFVVSGDEASSSVILWDGVSGHKLQSIPFDGVVVDVCHVTSSRPNDVSKLALLTDKMLAVYRRVPTQR